MYYASAIRAGLRRAHMKLRFALFAGWLVDKSKYIPKKKKMLFIWNIFFLSAVMLMLLNYWAKKVEYLKIIGSDIIENYLIKAIIKWERLKYGLNVKDLLCDSESIKFSDMNTFINSHIWNIHIYIFSALNFDEALNLLHHTNDFLEQYTA